MNQTKLDAIGAAMLHMIETELECTHDGEPKDLWVRCLMMYAIRSSNIIADPVCAFSTIAGITHQEARDAFEEMARRAAEAAGCPLPKESVQ